MFHAASVNSTSTTGGESSVELLNDRINLISATTLLGFTYGIIATLYCITTYFLLKKLSRHATRFGSRSNSLLNARIDWRNTIFYLVYTTILFVLVTLYTAGNSKNAIIAYVDNRLYPGGPSQYYILFMTGQWNMIMTDVSAVLILWMTDALILGRFIIIYSHIPYARWIIPFPCAMYIGVIVLNVVVLNAEASLDRIYYLSENMLLAYYALSLSLNILTTALIAARLYWHKVQLERVFGTGTESPYMSIATMLIESAAIYGVWSVLFLILCVQKSPGQTVILATMSDIQVIAPLLITLWFARGKAWNHGQNYTDAQSSGAMGLSFGSRPRDELSVDNAHPNTDRDASWVVRAGHRNGDNMIELGLCSSKPSILADDLKA